MHRARLKEVDNGHVKRKLILNLKPTNATWQHEMH